LNRREREKKRIAKIRYTEGWNRCRNHVENLMLAIKQDGSDEEWFDSIIRKLSTKDLGYIAGSDIYFDKRFRERAESELMLRKFGIEEKR